MILYVRISSVRILSIRILWRKDILRSPLSWLKRLRIRSNERWSFFFVNPQPFQNRWWRHDKKSSKRPWQLNISWSSHVILFGGGVSFTAYYPSPHYVGADYNIKHQTQQNIYIFLHPAIYLHIYAQIYVYSKHTGLELQIVAFFILS